MINEMEDAAMAELGNADKCFFCERELDFSWERIFFNPNWVPGEPKTEDWTKVKSCCMGCEGKVKKYMEERETKQAVNKDGKLLFVVEDGESHWYLGDSQEQVIEHHKSFDDIEVEDCTPVTVLEALKLTVNLDEYNKDKVVMFEFINEGGWYYDNGVALVSSTAY